MNWFYVDQGQQAGPVSDAQLAELVSSGKITADTRVWHEGMADWQPYHLARTGAQPTAGAGQPEANPAPEAICTECGKLFPTTETIKHGSHRVCVQCKPIFMQKLSEGAKLYDGALDYARILTRFAAVFIDGLLLMAVNLLIGLVAGLSASQAVGIQPKGALAVQMVLFVIQMTIGIGYEVFMIGKYGATLGKMACKIQVVTADGGKVSYARALGRYFAKLLSAFTCMIGYIIAIFDGQKRALHDHNCNTRVVCK